MQHAILLIDNKYHERNKEYTQIKGSKVEVLFIRDEVAIIQNDKGHKFSCRVEHLKMVL